MKFLCNPTILDIYSYVVRDGGVLIKNIEAFAVVATGIFFMLSYQFNPSVLFALCNIIYTDLSSLLKRRLISRVTIQNLVVKTEGIVFGMSAFTVIPHS